MSDHELRRAISRGPFTDFLDKVVSEPQVERAFEGCNLLPDDKQKLLLRYFVLTKCDDKSKFGMPSIAQQGLETMKRLNKEMEAWEAGESITKSDQLIQPLLDALYLASELFHKNEPFRRPTPLIKNGKHTTPGKVWVNSNKANPAIFSCIVYCLSRGDILRRQIDLLEHRERVRSELLGLMQMDPSFTDSLHVSSTAARIRSMTERLHYLLSEIDSRDRTPISSQTRLDLIQQARRSNARCPICEEALSRYDDHNHIDHIKPRAKGGTNDLGNLQVVHRVCNLRKGAN